MFQISRILPFLSNVIPTGLALQGLSKVDNRLKNFISYATGAGYASDQIMDFIKSKFDTGAEERVMQNANGRPDQQANAQMVRQSQQPRDLLKGAASLATGIGAGALGAMEGQPGSDQVPSPEQQQQPAMESNQQPNSSAKENTWGLFQQGKTSSPDSAISGFLKIADNLKKYNGLNSKEQFDQLWDDFEDLTSKSNSLPEVLRELTNRYTSRLSLQKDSQRGNQAMNNLMAALQAAKQLRQNQP